jgi:glyoxylase-like metal-dependent hydrolase (beta-lactamase superfamily II)
LLQNKHHPCSEVTEISPGIFLHPITGPSLQGSVVEVNRGADRILYLGDLCPTMFHVNPLIIPAFDDNPEASYAERMHWIELAMSGGYKVIFGHGNKVKEVWIEEHKGGPAIKPA